MLIAIAALLAATPHSPVPCASYAVAADAADAALVAKGYKKAVSPGSVTAVLGSPSWRIIWAEPADSEPGIFFFRRNAGRLRYIDVWGGPTSDAAGASRWARRLGVPTALARCFAQRLIREGP